MEQKGNGNFIVITQKCFGFQTPFKQHGMELNMQIFLPCAVQRISYTEVRSLCNGFHLIWDSYTCSSSIHLLDLLVWLEWNYINWKLHLALSTNQNIGAIQAKLQQAKEEKAQGQDVATLQQEENVSISGSNARLMIMKKLSRKSEVSRTVVQPCMLK